MNNRSKNKLVIVSKQDYGREFILLPGRTTIGSAPGNDVQLGYQNVSGYHAEFQIEKNKYCISDFSSEKGTFVNNKKISDEKHVKTGDIIKIGSIRTVFIPCDAIYAKKNRAMEDYLYAIKTGAPTYKKWLIMACVLLVLMSAIKMIAGKSSNHKALEKEMIAKKNKSIGTVQTGKETNGAKNEQKKSHVKSVRQNKISSINNALDDASGVSAGNKQSGKKKHSKQDNIPTIHFNIANKFSEYQLWRDALEHYHKVLENNYDYPGLSARIDKMKFELNNQEKYQHGQLLITNGNYEEGIAKLKNINKKSFYYNKALQEISDARENLAKLSKNK